jgi:hypothetical protein
LLATAGPVATGNDYASALKIKVPPQTGKMMVHLKEQDTDVVDWKILGSIDDENYSEEMSEAEVAQDGFDVHEITKAWLYVDVQVKSAVAENPGLVSIAISGGG